MLTGDIRNQVDQIWNAFWSGRVSNPLSVIEQITYPLFIKRLDDLHTLEENKSQTLGIPMDRRIFPLGKDDKGCVYEDMLGKIASAGQNGQFRTPRHFIQLMVEMVEPTPDDVMCDPAAGTFGFPVAVGESVNSRSWCCPRISQSAPLSGHGASTNTSSMSPSRSAMSTGRVSMPACDQGVPQPRLRRAGAGLLLQVFPASAGITAWCVGTKRRCSPRASSANPTPSRGRCPFLAPAAGRPASRTSEL
ncbi:MAG: SAM-dependent DNA methyltransferase [Thiocapsa sp.]|uniref:N-6 DNA methylase n=1 Tax=Thiocapsa sp. TaxID=2024551 RepID=UPI001BCF923F|nr:N-6 DNA methylase [Thiocapsa sp.]QVL48435.1 MAG: SAM-dependent DNA methyltransferase [Thiocapsa sp.]